MKLIAIVKTTIAFISIICQTNAFQTPSNEQCHLKANTLEENEDVFLPSSAFLDMYKHASINPMENIVMSPLSVSLALSTIYAGAKGETANEIKTAIFDDKVDVTVGIVNSMKHFLEENKPIKLDIANGLFLNESFELKKDFKSLSKECLISNVQTLPFTSKPASSIATINDWVNNKTHKLIPSMLSSDLEIGTFSAILINAIYFKGAWKDPFVKGNTKDEKFYGVNGDKLIEMMHDWEREAGYFEDNQAGVQMLELDYEGKEMSMIFVLPNKTKNFEEFERSLTAKHIHSMISNMSKENMNTIKIPKFKVESQILLKELLSKMGVKSMFDFKIADLSGISAEKYLYVSEVFQKAVITVDEIGTEAAAATGVVMETGSAPGAVVRRKFIFIADSPFLYLLYDKKTKTVLFIGKYVG